MNRIYSDKPTRIAKWDNAKLLLITCVVAGHMMNTHVGSSASMQKLYYFIYLFHMPAFVLVSGLFAKRAIREKEGSRAVSFLLLYFLIKFLTFGMRLAVGAEPSLSFFSESGVAWYAFAMFVFYLLTMFLQQFDGRYVLGAAIVLGCMAGYDSDIGNRLVLSRIFVFYPFFLMGYYLEPKQLLAVMRKPLVRCAAAAVTAAALLICLGYGDQLYWSINFLKGKTAFAKFERIGDAGALYRLLHYAVSSLLSLSILTLIPERRFCFSSLGQRTLGIYALHWPCVDLFYKGLGGKAWLKQLWPEHYLILVPFLGILLTLFLSLRPFDWIVGKLITLPKAEDRKKDGKEEQI